MNKTILILMIVALTAIGAGGYFLYKSQQKPLPVLGQVNDFELVNTSEQKFGLDELKDQVWVANFIFTRCQGPCPMLTQKMGKLQKQYSEQSKVRFVTVTVDPNHDNPQVLKEYGEKFGADFNQWQFLTGELKDVERVMIDEFKLGYAEDIMMHSDRMVLVDHKARIRGYYTGGSAMDYKKLKNDLAKVTQELD